MCCPGPLGFATILCYSNGLNVLDASCNTFGVSGRICDLPMHESIFISHDHRALRKVRKGCQRL